MRLFTCQACGQLLYFENTQCERCQRRLGYLPERETLSALEPEGEAWRALARPGATFRFCDNAAHDVCNWLIAADAATPFCAACRHNRTIPDLSDPSHLALWRKLEWAKHRLIYTLRRLRLPLRDRTEDTDHGLAFDFLAEPADPAAPRVLTGHADGVITVRLDEADDARREGERQRMGESYRTVLGHMRHEVGHHYWDLLVRDAGRLEPFRALFGDERQDYAAALAANYENGPPTDWQDHFVSAYASAHPWEDFAETWAHYLHIVDTLEMAAAFGLEVHPKAGRAAAATLETEIDLDPHHAARVEDLLEHWLPLTFAVNSLNRCMGQRDLYPFVIAPPVIGKLGFVHRLVRDTRQENRAAA